MPHCTITIYLTGTTTKATLYSDIGGTPLANPFTANALTGLLPGKWLAWAAINQGYDVVGSGGDAPNTYPAPVTLCSDCYPGSSFSGAPTVIQVNGTPTSPVSPVNFVDSGTVTFQRTGATISATAAGSGTCPGSVPATAVLSTDGTNCVGDSYFTYSDFIVDINRFASLVVEQNADIQVYAPTDPTNNNWQFTGNHLDLISNGANGVLGSMFLNVNDGSFTGIGTSGPLPLLINAQTTRAGHTLAGIEVTHSLGGIAALGVTGYEYDAPGMNHPGDSATGDVIGYLAAMTGRPGTVGNNDVAFWATTPVGQTIASNYCDFYASANTGAAVRGSLFCGPTYASLFNGPVTLGTITGSTQCLHVNTSGLISGTGADCGAGAGTITGSGTANYYSLWTGTTALGNGHLDDGVTTAATITSSEPIAVAGSTHGVSIPAGPAVAGAAGKVIYASDATSGFAEVNENNTGLSRVCTVLNGLCAGGGGSGTVTSVAQTVPSWLAVGGSPVITTGTLAITAATGQTSHQVLGTCGTATSFAPCSLTVADLPALPLYLNWTFNTGAAATDAAPRLLASHASSISTCYVLTTASDGATALTLNIFDNGTSVFSGGAQTVAAGTAAGTLTTLGSLTSTPLSIANNDKLSINITSGTSSWIFTVQCK